MEQFIYQTKPYATIALGSVTIMNPAPWWGLVCGLILVTVGGLILGWRSR